MQGLYLLDNDQVVSGAKMALATAQPRNLVGQRELIVKTDAGYLVTGQVTIAKPEIVSLRDFDQRVKEHQVNRTQRRRWWPDADVLTLHSLTYSAYPQPRLIELAPGCGMCVELRGLGLKEVAVEDGCYIYEVE